MSVINQMLQDLEKRQNEPEQPIFTGHKNASNKVSNKTLLIIVICLLVITIVLSVFLIFKQPNADNQKKPQNAAGVIKSSFNNVSTDIAPEQSQQISSTPQSAIQAGENLELQANAKNEKVSDTQAIHSSATDSAAVVLPMADSGQSKTNENTGTRDVKNKVTSVIEKPTVEATNDSAIASVSVIESSSSAEIADVSKSKVQKVTKSQSVNSKSTIESVNAPVQMETKPNSQQTSMKLEPVTLSKDQLLIKKREELAKAKSQQDMPTAIAIAREIYQLSPRNITGVQEYAALLYADEQSGLAADILMSSLSFDSPAGDLRLMLAKLYYQQGRLSAASQVLKSFSGSIEQANELISFRAALYQQLELFVDSNSDYRSLVTFNPKNASWLLGLAISSEQLGDKQAALIAYYSAKQNKGLSDASMHFISQRIQVLEGQ